MNLDLIPNGAIKRVHVSQNDIGRTLTFELFNDSLAYTVPSGATVKIQGTKPSGFGFSETCSVSGNVATVDTTEAMTDEFGYIEAELQITNSGDVLGTSNFILAVEKNPHPSNTTDGTQITAQSLEVRIEALEESALGGLTDEVKQALLNCFAHVAWIDEDGQDYYDALEDALYPPANLVSISCVYTQSGTVYDTDSLDDLRADLVVTAHYDNGTTQTVTSYTLSGTLTEGTSVITVAYGGKTTTFDVTVTKGLDYTEDALTNATWSNNQMYNKTTGVVSAQTGSYITDKFTVQDLSYSVANLDTTNNTTFYLCMWDSDNSYLGYKQSSTARFQLKPNYQYAIEVRNASTFDPSTITMLPVDKRATAVDEFEIDLVSMASSVTKANGYYELNVTSQMSAVGVTRSNYTDTIDRQSIIGVIGQSVGTGNFPFKTPIRIGTFHYSSNMLLSIFVEGITVSDANLATLQNYLVENNVKIKYNY